jgi:predicted lipoprotein with Yx(FWY)xxD motif
VSTKMTTLRMFSVAGLAAAAFAAVANASSPSTVVSTAHTSLGTVLVTSSGKTLYLDTGDKPPKFACTGSCLKVWPPLKAVGTVKASGSAKASLLGTVKGPDGKTVTYNGHPLYTFVSDTKGNPTSGEGQHGFYAVSAAGAKVTKSTTTTTTSSTSSKYTPPKGGQGY